MSTYLNPNSVQDGSIVEGKLSAELRTKINNGGGTGAGGITTETDPIFSASVAAGITTSNMSTWNSAVQPAAISDMATKTWVNNEGFLKSYTEQYQGTVTSVAVKMNGVAKGTITSSGTIDLGTIITEHQDISEKADSADLTTHTENTDIHVTTANKTAWNAKYDKPSTGIPKTDLSNGVQTSLGLADSALQTHQSIKTVNNNTITGTGNVSVGTVTSAGITAGTGITVSGSPITTSGNITVGLPTTMVGSTTVSSISSIPVTHRAVLATISANGTLSFASLPGDGFEVHVIIRNSGSSTISITLPSSGSYVCTSESTIYVAAGKYAEVNVLTIGSTGYIHGISSI